MNANIRSTGPQAYRDLYVRPAATPRARYVLIVSGTLAAVTFALVYLTTLSYVSGF
jgi:hypothetical protein